MTNNWYLGKIANIKIYVHWSFLILLSWILISFYMRHQDMREALLGVLFILIVFACITLHELGHALTARRYGITTSRITLLPIGGLASMEKMPENPVHELWVALAGPAVNFVIAMVLGMVIYFTTGFPTLGSLQESMSLTADNFLFQLFFVNMLLAVFNLIPAFPMDGGRVLRALLSMTTDRVRATAIAASVGRFLAIGFIFFGIFNDFWLVFIGIFIYLGASAEEYHESTGAALEGHTVADVLMRQFRTLYPSQPLQRAVELLLDSQDTEFIVLDINGAKAVGTLTSKDILEGLTRFGKDARISQAMQKKVLELSPKDPLSDIIQKMMMEKIDIAPVYDGGQLVGVLDRNNIQEFLMVQAAVKKVGFKVAGT
ncbi:MAG TPA: site-2 protease family protein [Bacteroidetes bacterium]|nr:site-2 protease family protein [Bacteroidota bacterium]